MQTTSPNQPVKEKPKKIYIVIAVLFVLAILSSFLRKNNSDDDTKYLDIAARGNATKVEAHDLYAEYSNNEIRADQTYKNNMLQVSGSITAIGTDILDNPYVELDDHVSCRMEDKNALTSLNKGQFITITGICDGKTIDIIIKNGQIY